MQGELRLSNGWKGDKVFVHTERKDLFLVEKVFCSSSLIFSGPFCIQWNKQSKASKSRIWNCLEKMSGEIRDIGDRKVNKRWTGVLRVRSILFFSEVDL